MGTAAASATVLVVDDDQGLSRLIQRTLQREGFRFVREDPLQLAIWVYWMLGLILQRYHLPRWGDARTSVAHFGLIAATALLCSTAPRLVPLWALGIQGGYLPLDLFGDYAGTQGPWRHVQLSLILNQTLFLPLPAFLLSVASGLVQTSRRAWMTALLALLMFSMLMATHYWLND